MCSVDCIYAGGRKLYVNPSDCIDCGACEPACPPRRSKPDRSVPEDQLVFIENNARVFDVILPVRGARIGSASRRRHWFNRRSTPLVTAYRTAVRIDGNS